MIAPRRPITLYVGLLIGTVLLGLSTRRYPDAFPDVIARFGGDALWATAVFWIIALMRRRSATLGIGVSALAIAFLVEMSQLYRAPWIEAVRATGPGALALGHGFLWSDLLSYAVGVLLAAATDAAIVGKRSK